MIVSMCGLWGSSLFSELFLMTVFLTVLKFHILPHLAMREFKNAAVRGNDKFSVSKTRLFRGQN